MQTATPFTQLLRVSQVASVYAMSVSGVRKLIRFGTFPPPIKIGEKASAWRADEVQALIDARARGTDEDGIRALVDRLVRARRRAGKDVAVQ